MDRVLLISAMSAYLAAFALSYWRRNLALLLAAAALLPHGIAILLRWYELGHGPYVGLFDSLSSNLWVQLFLFLMLALLDRPARAATSAALGLSAIFALWLMFVPPEPTNLPPTYTTWWLYLHLYAGKLSYGLLYVSLSLSISRREEAQVYALGRVPQLMLLAFICYTLMLFAGGNWAYLAWGKYWDWNALEIWTLITWLGFGLFFHARLVSNLKQNKNTILWFTAIVYILAVLTFYGVPFLSKATHQGLV